MKNDVVLLLAGRIGVGVGGVVAIWCEVVISGIIWMGWVLAEKKEGQPKMKGMKCSEYDHLA